MIEPYFSSISSTPLIEVVAKFLLKIPDYIKQQNKLEVQIMLFSFTDVGICELILELATAHPEIQFNIIGDWGNVAEGKGRQMHRLGRSPLANLRVRLKYDQPFVLDDTHREVRWNYQASFGLLHHKTVNILVNKKPVQLLTGSFNWTKAGGLNYENIVIFEASDATRQIMAHFKDEFNTLWTNPQLSVSFEKAVVHYEYVKRTLLQNPGMDGHQIAREFLNRRSTIEAETAAKQLLLGTHFVAFSGTNPFFETRKYGFAPSNSHRYFMMMKNSGKLKQVPLELHTVALDLIFRTQGDSLLRIAMFALSHRVPEYSAILEAARRGVQVKLILDRGANAEVIQKLKEVVHAEKIPLQYKFGKRSMHQKYMVDEAQGNVVTGTANMTTDATFRHAEHRLLFRSDKDLARRFSEDFDTIWSRVTSEGP